VALAQKRAERYSALTKHPNRSIVFYISTLVGEIFGGFGVEFSADLAKFSADLGLNFQRIWRKFQRVWAGFHRHWRVWSLRMSTNFHRFCRVFAPHTPAFPRFPLLTGGLCNSSCELLL
jgi:hypothetical protein